MARFSVSELDGGGGEGQSSTRRRKALQRMRRNRRLAYFGEGESSTRRRKASKRMRTNRRQALFDDDDVEFGVDPLVVDDVDLMFLSNEDEDEEDDRDDQEIQLSDFVSNSNEDRVVELEVEVQGVNEPAESNNQHASSSPPAADGSISVILTDPEVLDCNICYHSLKIPVFQCENGHIACSSCCTKIKNKCPSCSFPIGYNRCRAIEKVIESVKVLCPNSVYGCHERVSYNGRKDHEDTCICAPCTCPHSGCGFLGSCKQLARHCSARHSTSIRGFQYNSLLHFSLDKICKQIILQEEKDGALFILDNSVQINGNAITVKSIGPASSKRVLSYDLLARKDNNFLRIESFLENHSSEAVEAPSCFLLVPHAFFDSNGQLKMELCIRLSNLR